MQEVSGLMRKCVIKALLVTLFLAGCSHMEGVVKEIKINKDGDLVIRKCDEKLYWNLYFIVWGEINCREEVKPRPSVPNQ